MLNEVTQVDQVTVLEDGQLQVRTARIFRDGEVEIARTYHRHVEAPREVYEMADARVQAVAEAVWTPEVIADYDVSHTEGRF